MPSPTPLLRTTAYIDGFNLYHGLRDDGLRRYYWLDLTALGRNLLRPPQVLTSTKYFTARLSGPQPGDSPARAARLEDERRKQANYLDALDTLADFRRIDGHYLPKTKTCHRCGATWSQPEEKMTDVNIATEMLVDAFADRFDVALVVSADSDLAPPIAAVRRLFPAKRVLVAMPPKRNSAKLRQVADASFTIGRAKLRDSQLPDPVLTPNGYALARPADWA